MRKLLLPFGLVLLGCTGILGGDTADKPDSGDAVGGPDADGDGAADRDDCDPADPTVYPDAKERCNGFDDDCDGDIDEDLSTSWYEDRDGDGYGDGDATEGCEAPDGMVGKDGDCDDRDDAVHPGADESDCTDPTDYNCDGTVAYDDRDGDGWASCEDCNDLDEDVHTSTREVCNGRDDDCDGDIDVDASDCEIMYEDLDGDGIGGDATVCGCEGTEGFSNETGDCDDRDADVNPDATETCSTSYDDDCDGRSDDTTTSTAPRVNAGTDITVSAGSADCVESGYTWACDTCASVDEIVGDTATATDSEGDSMTYRWTVSPSGPTIRSATSLSTTVTFADAMPDEPGACVDEVYTFTLTVTDCAGKSASDTMKVTVNCCGREDT